jgi:hypothetical protein
MVTTLPGAIPGWALKVLTLNPPAVYISLVRVALMQSYRTNSPGNAPYSAAKCALFKLHSAEHIPLQAHCQAIVTNTDLWIAAVGWGVGFFALGIVFFWQAENKYGRG